MEARRGQMAAVGALPVPGVKPSQVGGRGERGGRRTPARGIDDDDGIIQTRSARRRPMAMDSGAASGFLLFAAVVLLAPAAAGCVCKKAAAAAVGVHVSSSSRFSARFWLALVGACEPARRDVLVAASALLAPPPRRRRWQADLLPAAGGRRRGRGQHLGGRLWMALKSC